MCLQYERVKSFSEIILPNKQGTLDINQEIVNLPKNNSISDACWANGIDHLNASETYIVLQALIFDIIRLLMVDTVIYNIDFSFIFLKSWFKKNNLLTNIPKICFILLVSHRDVINIIIV